MPQPEESGVGDSAPAASSHAGVKPGCVSTGDRGRGGCCPVSPMPLAEDVPRSDAGKFVSVGVEMMLLSSGRPGMPDTCASALVPVGEEASLDLPKRPADGRAMDMVRLAALSGRPGERGEADGAAAPGPFALRRTIDMVRLAALRGRAGFGAGSTGVSEKPTDRVFANDGVSMASVPDSEVSRSKLGGGGRCAESSAGDHATGTRSSVRRARAPSARRSDSGPGEAMMLSSATRRVS